MHSASDISAAGDYWTDPSIGMRGAANSACGSSPGSRYVSATAFSAAARSRSSSVATVEVCFSVASHWVTDTGRVVLPRPTSPRI